MQLNILKYILDIESVISEIESIKLKANNDFSAFKSDMILRRAADRDLEIIGLRNLISHAYDSIEPEMIWGIIQNNIPTLSSEILKIKSS